MNLMLAAIYACGLLLTPIAVAGAPSSTLVVEASAQAPVAHFNRHLQQAAREHQHWINDYREIARRFACPDDKNAADIIAAQQRLGTLYVAVLTSLKPPRIGEQTLYLLQLKQQRGLWQIERARVAWRCHSYATFSTARCEVPGRDVRAP